MTDSEGGNRGGDSSGPPSAKVSWTKEQLKVIGAPVSDRTLVSAGPGTGKTAVTCARIAHLISEKGIAPSRIWLVSFTRTAVHELRQRVALFLGDSTAAAGLRIATIDSHAWAIHSGFNAEATLSGSFDDNIKGLIELIKSHAGVFEYLTTLEHLFIDEAQDIIGIRCELMLELINAIPTTSGVTVLADDAQAIYGFSEDATAGTVEQTLPVAIREHFQFQELELTEIHRTKDPMLRKLFATGRGLVLTGSAMGRARVSAIKEFLESTNHGSVGEFRADIESLSEEVQDAFLLFRRRGDALQASSYLANRPHRIRMSGLPTPVHDWIARLFWDYEQQNIDLAEFKARWVDRLPLETRISMDDAWENLVRLCGTSKTRISVSQLASRLGRGAPPIELSDPDFGSRGPVVGTIHGSKGREASEVRLYLPPLPGDNVEDEAAAEEARILFVGATRAKYSLIIGKGPTRATSRRIDSGRAFTAFPYGKYPARACVEIGRTNDIDVEGLTGKRFFQSKAKALAAQRSISRLPPNICQASAVAQGKELDYRYLVSFSSLPTNDLCYLTDRVGKDMWRVAEQVDNIVHAGRRKPPNELRYLRIFGTRTVALAPDDAARQKLHSPWKESGFMLAPMVLGYGMVFFRY